MTITTLKRKFKFKNQGETITIDDPNPEMQPREVLDFLSSTYPQLTNAQIGKRSIEDNHIIISLETTVGTKG